MSCFRVSCHPLQIERRRYHRPTPIPANERYCPFCLQRKLEMVKDEAHFMIECESYIERGVCYLMLQWPTTPLLPILMWNYR